MFMKVIVVWSLVWFKVHISKLSAQNHMGKEPKFKITRKSSKFQKIYHLFFILLTYNHPYQIIFFYSPNVNSRKLLSSWNWPCMVSCFLFIYQLLCVQCNIRSASQSSYCQSTEAGFPAILWASTYFSQMDWLDGTCSRSWNCNLWVSNKPLSSS